MIDLQEFEEQVNAEIIVLQDLEVQMVTSSMGPSLHDLLMQIELIETEISQVVQNGDDSNKSHLIELVMSRSEVIDEISCRAARPVNKSILQKQKRWQSQLFELDPGVNKWLKEHEIILQRCLEIKPEQRENILLKLQWERYKRICGKKAEELVGL
jgi:hypothetical protein